MKTNAKILIYFLIGVLFLGLIIYGYMGIFNRFWADDWCYNADFKELGFWGTLKGYSYIITYASNRYSLTLFSGLLNFLGINGVQIMTPLNLGLWTVGAFWVLSNIKKLTGFSISKFGIFGIVISCLYFTLYTAPHLYQSFYWRSGTLPYSEPIVFGVILFGIFFYQATLDKPSVFLIVVATILAFLTGGFSEAGCAALVTSIIIFIGLEIVFRKHLWAKITYPIAGFALFAALVSMAFLILSPTTEYRLGLYNEHATIMELPILILRYSFDFIKFSFLDAPLPILAIIGASGLLGYFLSQPGDRSLSLKTFLIIGILITFITIVLISSSFAPSAYIEKSPPAPRTRIIPRFIMTSGLVIITWLFGWIAKQYDRTRWLKFFAVILLILLVVYAVNTLNNVFELLRIFSDRAQLWDERSVEIYTAVEKGQKEVSVYGIDGLPVGGIGDFVPEGFKVYWVNICAARYYDLDLIHVPNP